MIMIDTFWDAVHTNNYLLIETILEDEPEYLFDKTQHYLGYNVVMYAAINEKYDLMEILCKNYVYFVKALHDEDICNRKIPQKYICLSLAHIICF